MLIKTFVKIIMNVFLIHKKQSSDIVLITLAKSGSTFLAELIMQTPKLKFVSEPFNMNDERTFLNAEKHLKRTKTSDRYLDLSKYDFKQIMSYLNRLSLNNYHTFHFKNFRPTYIRFFTNRSLFKIHRLTYYYEEVINNQNASSIYLIRHPISHSLSRFRSGWGDYCNLYLESSKIKDLLTNYQYSWLKKKIENCSSIELLLISWCLENLVFIYDFQSRRLPDNVLIVYYEDLLTNPSKIIPIICDHIGVPFNHKMLDLVKKPSKGVIHSTNSQKKIIKRGDTKTLLNAWKEKISAEELLRFQEILDVCNITIYKASNTSPIHY